MKQEWTFPPRLLHLQGQDETKWCKNPGHRSANCRRRSLSAVEVEQQDPPYEICALSDSESSDRYMEIIPEGTDAAEECDTSKENINPDRTVIKQVT